MPFRSEVQFRRCSTEAQLIQDSRKLFHLQYQVKAATHLLNQQLAKRSDQNLSNIQADIQEDDAESRLADFDEVEAPEATLNFQLCAAQSRVLTG